MDDFNVDPDLVNSHTKQDSWELGSDGSIVPHYPRPPWLSKPPPKKKKFDWPDGGKSPSWITRIATCQLEHANQYRHKLPNPTGLDGVIGNVVHGTLEDAARIRAFPSGRGRIPSVVRPAELLHLLELQTDCVRQDLSVVEGNEAAAIVTVEVMARSRAIIAALDPISLGNIWINRRAKRCGAEYVWQFPIDNQLLIAGVADLIQVQPDPTNPTDPNRPPLEVVITDYKTGYGQLPSHDELKMDVQAGLELCWARRAFPNTPRIRFRLFNLAHKESVYVDWTPGLDQIMLSFARACWNLWQFKDETPRVSSHCARCVYRGGCVAYEKHLKASAYRSPDSLEGKTMAELVQSYYAAKVTHDLSERRKSDASALLIQALGEKKVYETGRFTLRKKRRKLPGFRDETALFQDLSKRCSIPMDTVLRSASQVKKSGLEGLLMALPAEKQAMARLLIEQHQTNNQTPYWIEVKETNPAI